MKSNKLIYGPDQLILVQQLFLQQFGGIIGDLQQGVPVRSCAQATPTRLDPKQIGQQRANVIPVQKPLLPSIAAIANTTRRVLNHERDDRNSFDFRAAKNLDVAVLTPCCQHFCRDASFATLNLSAANRVPKLKHKATPYGTFESTPFPSTVGGCACQHNEGPAKLWRDRRATEHT